PAREDRTRGHRNTATARRCCAPSAPTLRSRRAGEREVCPPPTAASARRPRRTAWSRSAPEHRGRAPAEAGLGRSRSPSRVHAALVFVAELRLPLEIAQHRLAPLRIGR